ncbi:Abi family protein [Corynebacterium amycolatum]|uniref:Abi family protein n=1 Tax=Corynebacterium TaxID=1716 RepID=UPI00114CA7DB|nr:MULTISPECIES: Abi family protein [unclassified Corynebacterium]
MTKLPFDLDVSYEMGTPRFSTYLRCSNNTLEASRLYMWNLSLAARWWGPLSYTEVALRNKLHDALADSVGRDDWWEEDNLGISDKLAEKIKSAEAYAKVQCNDPNPTADNVVAASSFGVWTTVLHYENAPSLWRNHLQNEFDSDIRRGQLFHNAYNLKKLRDRIAHHEPIFNRNQQEHLTQLDYVLEAIHPDLPDLAQDCFPGLRKTIDGQHAAISFGEVDL